jgi:hypothetical protein
MAEVGSVRFENGGMTDAREMGEERWNIEEGEGEGEQRVFYCTY